MLLLDTCTLLWLASDQSKLSATARSLLASAPRSLFVSAISAFEIGIKHQKGKYVLPSDPEVWFFGALRLHGLRQVPVSARIAIRSTKLPPVHSDPADRIIVATAQDRGLTILTPDHIIHRYPDVTCLW